MVRDLCLRRRCRGMTRIAAKKSERHGSLHPAQAVAQAPR
jgi:hypothetical protein